MFDTMKFILVEDKEPDLKEVLVRLADAGFVRENLLGTAATYDEAKSLLEQWAPKVDVVFLDLNIPRDTLDGQPEKGHGKALLDLIHGDLNVRANVAIKVIIVSGEVPFDGYEPELLKQHYAGTLTGIAGKSDLPVMLAANLRRLRKDPLRTRLAKSGLEIVDSYDVLVDASQPSMERLKSARAIAISLLRNELAHYHGALGWAEAQGLADDLSGLIKRVEDRFAPDRDNRRRVKAAAIQPVDGWAVFLWRGTMIQHLYTINAYRNVYEHLPEQPFRSRIGEKDGWQIPKALITELENATAACKAVELLIHEVLEWYMPWHEQVYVPWQARVGGHT